MEATQSLDLKSQIQILMWILGFFGAIVTAVAIWAIQKLISTFIQMLKTIGALENNMEKVLKSIEPLPKIQKDLDYFHHWKRVQDELRGQTLEIK